MCFFSDSNHFEKVMGGSFEITCLHPLSVELVNIKSNKQPDIMIITNLNLYWSYNLWFQVVDVIIARGRVEVLSGRRPTEARGLIGVALSRSLNNHWC